MTDKEFVLQSYPYADIHAHGRDIWIFALNSEAYRNSGYDNSKQLTLSNTFYYNGSWEAVADETIWEETCLPVWADAANRIRNNNISELNKGYNNND